MWTEFEVNGGFGGGEDRRNLTLKPEWRGAVRPLLRSFHSFPRDEGDNVEVLIALSLSKIEESNCGSWLRCLGRALDEGREIWVEALDPTRLEGSNGIYEEQNMLT
jgi:hypothetical protein